MARLFLALLLFCIPGLSLNIRVGRASGTIYVMEDGSIDPPTAPIQRVGNLYTFTADIYDSIVVRKSSITIDGNHFNLQGSGTGTGILTDWAVVLGVTIRNTIITGFGTAIRVNSGVVEDNRIENNTNAIYCEQSIIIRKNVIANNSGDAINLISIASSGATTVSGNIITRNGGGAIRYLYSSHGNWINNTVTNNYVGIVGHYLSSTNIEGNEISNNTNVGIYLYDVIGNTITENSLKHNNVAIFLQAFASDLTNNKVTGNLFAYNKVVFQTLAGTFPGVKNNFFYHNNFIDNALHVNGTLASNYWDDGYPSGGNYWSDYVDVDEYSGPNQDQLGSDNIWDHPYAIDPDNQDHYPLVNKWSIADVNRDGTVNELDAAAISAHWYPGPPIGPLGYDPNFDINDDGNIDVLDAAIVSAYWTGPPKGPLVP